MRPPRTSPDGEPRQIVVRGPGLVPRYWDEPEATARAFIDGWFQTGDIAVARRRRATGSSGRRDQDIIKTGGFKVSALEIESAIAALPASRSVR